VTFDLPPPPLQLSQPKPAGHPERTYHSFLAGALGGYLVWGRYSSVNYQIVLYLSSRVAVALYHKLAMVLRERRRRRNTRRTGSGGTQQRGRGTVDSAATLATTSGGARSSSSSSVYPWAAAVVWGLVMALFEESPEVLHPSLKTSMDEIYRYSLLKRSKSDVARGGDNSGNSVSQRNRGQQRLRPDVERQLTI